MRVSVQVFSYDEAYDDIWSTMDAYAACETPSFADVDYWACVTPKRAPTARSPRAAREHPKFALLETPRGKLASRNEAHARAAREGYDVIVVGDADGPPLTDRYLEHLLLPLRTPGVVAVNSHPVSTGGLSPIIDTVTAAEDLVQPHMHGQGSAFTTDAWRAVGPFDTSVDQTEVWDVRRVEEFDFYRDLRSLGDVKFSGDAVVTNDTRRIMCYLQRVRPRMAGTRYSYCDRTGVETFSPARER